MTCVRARGSRTTAGSSIHCPREARLRWLPNTADQGYDYFNRYYFAQQDRQGVILDERSMGRYIADISSTFSRGTCAGYFTTRSRAAARTEPITGIFCPQVMLNQEYAAPGQMLPYLFH